MHVFSTTSLGKGEADVDDDAEFAEDVEATLGVTGRHTVPRYGDADVAGDSDPGVLRVGVLQNPGYAIVRPLSAR